MRHWSGCGRAVPDASVVEAMGAEVGLDAALCSAPATRVLCCQRLQKLAVMYAAVGATDGAPTVMANKAKLDAVAAAYFHVSQGYNASVPQDVARGSLGLPLARELLRNMRAKMLPEGDANRNTKMMMQYAHRVPIQTALGHDPSDATPLGETFLVDLLRDDATNAYFVRLRYAAAANDAPAAAFFPFRCLSAADVPTDATTADGVICPFDDFARFVESSSGTSAAGAACYLDEETRKEVWVQRGGRRPLAGVRPLSCHVPGAGVSRRSSLRCEGRLVQTPGGFERRDLEWCRGCCGHCGRGSWLPALIVFDAFVSNAMPDEGCQ
ncbi:putative membrane-bound acid phosphatase [Trypanosoma cruzi]|uniref:Putative membrane-bound acid phosphatase n=1 Tax=Trypanosoma cruzi TaxID=5693 RepID=A0A2V2VSS5_TRYCR|nr:putative membrane-bound acid phosphatase [Trypanosoma cruzi]